MQLAFQIAFVLVAAVAAVTDWRRGEIPNWLTLPALVLAPIGHLVAGGLEGLAASLLGGLGCGLAPYLMFRWEAMGGGDVKLLAALGAIGGFMLGLEAQLFGLLLAAPCGLWLVARRGALGEVFGNVARLVINPFVPSRMRRQVALAPATAVRLGVFVLGGAIAALARNIAMI